MALTCRVGPRRGTGCTRAVAEHSLMCASSGRGVLFASLPRARHPGPRSYCTEKSLRTLPAPPNAPIITVLQILWNSAGAFCSDCPTDNAHSVDARTGLPRCHAGLHTAWGADMACLSPPEIGNCCGGPLPLSPDNLSNKKKKKKKHPLSQ